jgi:endonuclease YncB( thermonuclease family)
MSILCTVFGACLTLTGMASVHDGDTITLRDHHIRIHGLDAEELDERNGRRARDALVRIINSQPVTCRSTGHTSHHRIIARCRTSEGKDIAELMVRGGHALDCLKYSGGAYVRFETREARTHLTSKPYCDPNLKR